MGLLDRIAKYFTEWDGEDKTAPKMELCIDDLRYVASMNVDRCRAEARNRELMKKIEDMKSLMEKSAEEIENLYGEKTSISKEIRSLLDR